MRKTRTIFLKHRRCSKLFAPMCCSICEIELVIGDHYYARSGVYQLCTTCFEKKNTPK